MDKDKFNLAKAYFYCLIGASNRYSQLMTDIAIKKMDAIADDVLMREETGDGSINWMICNSPLALRFPGNRWVGGKAVSQCERLKKSARLLTEVLNNKGFDATICLLDGKMEQVSYGGYADVAQYEPPRVRFVVSFPRNQAKHQPG